MKSPTVSVIMPVFNAEKTLVESIESILHQSFSDFEFIIINDCSTDKSLSIIENFQRQDRRIRLINLKQNVGIVGALNSGLAAATGTYIARIDADDIAHARRFEIQLRYIQEKQLDIIGSTALFFNQTTEFVYRLNLKYLTNEEIKIVSLFSCPFIHSSVMINRSFLVNHHLKYELYHFNYAEDYDLWVRMIMVGAKSMNILCPLVKYRMSTSSLSAKNRDEQTYARIEIMKKYWSHNFSMVDMEMLYFMDKNDNLALDDSLIKRMFTFYTAITNENKIKQVFNQKMLAYRLARFMLDGILHHPNYTEHFKKSFYQKVKWKFILMNPLLLYYLFEHKTIWIYRKIQIGICKHLTPFK